MPCKRSYYYCVNVNECTHTRLLYRGLYLILEVHGTRPAFLLLLARRQVEKQREENVPCASPGGRASSMAESLPRSIALAANRGCCYVFPRQRQDELSSPGLDRRRARIAPALEMRPPHRLSAPQKPPTARPAGGTLLSRPQRLARTAIQPRLALGPASSRGAAARPPPRSEGARARPARPRGGAS